MVNTESSSFVTSSDLAAWLVEEAAFVAYELAGRLAKAGHLEFAALRLSFQPQTERNGTSISAFLQAFETEAALPLRVFTEAELASHYLTNRQSLFEANTLKFLAQVANRNINVTLQIPTTSSLVTTHMETLFNLSPFYGVGEPGLDPKTPSHQDFVKYGPHLCELLSLESFNLAHLRKTLSPHDCGKSLTRLFHLASSLEVTQMVLQDLSLHFLQVPDNTTSISELPTLWRKKREGLRLRECLMDSVSAFSRESFSHLRRKIVKRLLLETSVELFTSLRLAEDTLVLLQQFENTILLPHARSGAQETGNCLYCQSLLEQLRGRGEPLEEAHKLVDALYTYSAEKKVDCRELLDEEVSRLNPRINRETLVHSRLALRLDDFHYPQSVKHKEWVLRTQKLAGL